MISYNKRSFNIGDLVEVIDVSDQGYFVKTLVGRVGMIIEHVPAKSYQNIWKVLFAEQAYNLHALDLMVVKPTSKI